MFIDFNTFIVLLGQGFSNQSKVIAENALPWDRDPEGKAGSVVWGLSRAERTRLRLVVVSPGFEAGIMCFPPDSTSGGQ